MKMFVPSVRDIEAFVELGGAVMPAILVLGVVIWFSLILRWMELGVAREASERDLEARMSRVASRGASESTRRWRLRMAAEAVRWRMRRAGVATELMIAAAPLLGLLGTISGMVETFDVLHMSQGFDRSQAMARGIAKALITTEFGLFLSIPAILVSRTLNRCEVRQARKVDEIEALLASRES